MRRNNRTRHSRKGMVMLVVLFIVMAIAIISSGFIARSDVALACGRNYCVRNEADYAAWGGLEVAWALVQDPNNIPYTQTNQSADWASVSNNLRYDLEIGSGSPAVADPNVIVYAVTSEAYKWVNSQRQATSRLHADLMHDTSSATFYLSSIRRED